MTCEKVKNTKYVMRYTPKDIRKYSVMFALLKAVSCLLTSHESDEFLQVFRYRELTNLVLLPEQFLVGLLPKNKECCHVEIVNLVDIFKELIIVEFAEGDYSSVLKAVIGFLEGSSKEILINDIKLPDLVSPFTLLSRILQNSSAVTNTVTVHSLIWQNVKSYDIG